MSLHFVIMFVALQTGIKNKKGIHKKREGSDKVADSFHVNDISQPGNASKAKQHLAFLTRGKQNAVVEAVLSGNRLKVNAGFRVHRRLDNVAASSRLCSCTMGSFVS